MTDPLPLDQTPNSALWDMRNGDSRYFLTLPEVLKSDQADRIVPGPTPKEPADYGKGWAWTIAQPNKQIKNRPVYSPNADMNSGLLD